MKLLLKNGRVYRNSRLLNANILIENGKIAGIGEIKKADKEIDCSGKIIIPGLIDGHVHFRIPGWEQKEDWKTGSRAAAAGGVTTVLDMPNNNPSITSCAELENKKKLAEKDSLVNFGLYLGATAGNISELENCNGAKGIKVFMGSSTGNLLVDKEEDLRKIFEAAKKSNKIVLVHAEDEELIKQNTLKHKTKNNTLIHNKVRNKEVALSAVRKALRLQKEIGNRLHFCHVTTKEEIDLIREAKQVGQKISCEVTPHHLFLSEDDLRELNNFGKMNPPLRKKEDMKSLWNALREGVIDCIATDHAPHEKELKEKKYWDAPSGVPGVETMLPLLLNVVSEGKISLMEIVRCCCENPARLFDLREKGSIAEGMDADLTVIDLSKENEIKNEELFTKCRWSPFHGRKLNGVVEKTLVNGELVFDSGKIVSEKKGKAV